ncbi:PAS domain S-box protein [Chloroflexota bacterium]
MKDSVKGKEKLTEEWGQLRQQIAEMEKLRTEYEQARHDLGKRVKELNCLYGIAELAETPDISLTEILRGTADLMPPSWQYPEVTCARIILENQEFRTDNFCETAWRQAADIRVEGQNAGIIEVYYLEERPQSDEGPFLKEERSLILAVAERLGRMVGHHRIEGEVQRLAKFPGENPNPVLRAAEDGTVIYANEASAPLLSYWACQVGEQLPADWSKLVSDVIGSGAGVSSEAEYEGHTMSLTFAPVVDLEQVNIYGLDITERKRAEQQLKAANQQLMASEQQLKAANQQLMASEQALRESAEKYRVLFEGYGDPIAVYDTEGCVMLFNEVWANNLGASPEDLIGKPLHEFLPERAEADVERIRQLVNSGKSEDFEDMVRLPSGEQWFWSRLQPVIDKEGNITAVQVVSHDITERKRAEENLERRERYYRALIEKFSEAVVILDREGNIVYQSPSYERVLGYVPHEEIGMNMFNNIHPDDIGNVAEAFNVLLQNPGDSIATEVRAHHPDGSWFNIEATATNLLDDSGVGGVVVNFRDVTERKKAEESLQESEQRYAAVVEQAMDGVMIAQDEVYKFINRSVEEMTGYTRQELEDRPLLDLVVPESRGAVAKRYYSRLAGEPLSAEYEVRLLCKDGTVKEIESRSRTIDYQGRPATLAIVRDITERKYMEEERQRAAKLESIGTLAGGIAHDFNNLLAGILGNVTLAKNFVGPKSETYEVLVEAEKASLRARDLTQQLLTFAKGGTPVKEMASVTEVIRESAQFAIRGSKVKGKFDLPDDLWPTEIDVGQIGQVVNNLVMNAVDSMPEGGIISISATNTAIGERSALPLRKREGGYVKISIADKGIGIAEEHLRKIFDPYFTTKQRGSGLGLATAYSIIKSHNGHITVESELGVGTTFHIYLPASKKRVRAKKSEAAKQPRLLGKGKILVMDDEEMIRKMLRKMLPLSGYEVEVASDGAEAVDLYAKARESGQPFNAVILDLTVPGGMGGREAIKKLLEIDPDVKAIVSSGYSIDPIMSDFREYGFSGVVVKPYSVQALEEILGEIVATEEGNK